MSLETVLFVSVLCSWTLGIASLLSLIYLVRPQLRDTSRLIDLIASVRGYRDEVNASYVRETARAVETSAPPPVTGFGMEPYEQEVPPV